MYEVWRSTFILRTYYNIVDIDFACISNTPSIVKAIDDNEIQVEITWIDGSETTEITSDVTVVDRRFKHGKVVASAVSTQQLGLVMNVNISVDLLSMDGKVIRNVCSKDLKPIKEVNVHDFVLLGFAFGKVKKTVDIVTILSDDGSICEAIDVNPLELRPLLKYTRNCPYYPGQRNGTKEYEVQSTSLILSSQNDDQFFPGNSVTEKTLSEEGDSIECNRVGVVVSVNFEDRIVEPQEIVVIILNDDETRADTSDSNGQETNSVNNGEDTTTSPEVSAGESQEDNISEYKFEHYDVTENATSREVTGDTQEDNIKEYEFKHFDIIENATDHHYYGGDKTMIYTFEQLRNEWI
ncbi:hypothetical protein ZIOFF_070289 [Zingiber officinale]|uniref:UBE2O-like tandem tSH3-B domain-containing protein n=1 Tax=Zingiber officinale TaxID=94328 RepID=A0A8J5CWL7_ZINOF|nr:hypothetical protein ZIOFF_070289 [Zingiber officinale]